MAQEFGTYIEVQNTPDGWAVLTKQAQRKTPLMVKTKIKGKLDDQQLFCLRYCFVELDQLERLKRLPSKISLKILVESQEDAYRIQHYLAIMTALRSITLEIVCDDKKSVWGRRKLTDDYYRILPLFCVGIDSQRWMVPYLAMVSPGKVEDLQKQVENSFQEKCPTTSTPTFSVQDLLEQFCMRNLWHLQREISGTDEEKMVESGTKEKNVKDTLRKELLNALQEAFPRLGLLARLFWSLFLRSLSDSKDLFFRDHSGKWHVDMETLRCTRLDAVSYAEGILQLVENACIHSDMKRAYVSIRLSDIDITAKSMERISEAARTRANIYRRHEQLLRGNSGPHGNSRQESFLEYQLDRQTKFCLELSVLNDSTASSGELWGITKMFAKNREKAWENMTLTDVFSYRCERLSDISKHYGLRLLEKTVQLNGGFFSVCSPGKSGTQERYASFYQEGVKRVYKQFPVLRDPCTDYDILLPLYPHWHDIRESGEGSSPPENLFQRKALTQREYRQRVLRFQAKRLGTIREGKNDSIFVRTDCLLGSETSAPANWMGVLLDQTEWLERKEMLIERIWRELLDATEREHEETLWIIDLMQVWDVLSLELLAKALFLLVAWRQKKHSEGLRLAVLLPNEMFTSEFIRIFSIFYDKQLSNARWMGQTQIALCGYQKDNAKLPQVHFLLAGETSGSARITARTFAYYNTGATLDLMPQIRYLTRTEKETSVPQFPFDLFLTAVPEVQKGQEESSWFLHRMRQALEQDLWRRPHGCRIQGIRVRLHSNIYLSDFYEAELLFHNVGIIYRFAYLIAKDLLGRLPPAESQQRPLVVIGYEFYSSVLTEQIVKLLEESWGQVYYLIYSTRQDGKRLHLSPRLKSMDGDAQRRILRQAEYVSVIPIGTTMSTLYRIMGEVKAQWQGSFPYDNYVLILVGEEGENILSPQYWTQADGHHVALQPQRQKDSSVLCRYYLSPQTQWKNMVCGTSDEGVNEKVLVYVDQTSTRPKDIFVVDGAHFRGTSHFLKTLTDRAENDRRLALFKGLIHYGHIAEGNNHFQFYLDMEQYFARAQQADPQKKRKTVDQWLQSLRQKIDPNAYNIIVSPLHREDSPFAKAVIDQVFEHSLRFLHVDLTTAFREDMRSKFSYVADEYREIRQYDRSKPVNVYFVNTAITSGSTLARARSLVTMLMEEAGAEYDRESIFKGCFVLVNRSAFDTLNSYVKEPEEHFWAYLHLAVPSFNSQRDRCPTCELLDQYQILEHSCAGNRLGQEFRRLQVKHAKRTLDKYRVWLEDTVMTSGGYAGWLRQWLYSYIRNCQKKGGNIWVGIFEVDEAQYADLNALYKLLGWGLDKYLSEQGMEEDKLPARSEDYLSAINSFTLTHLKRMVEEDRAGATCIVGTEHSHCLEPEYWKRTLIDYVCAQKNYLRLATIHKAFLKMDTLVGQLHGDLSIRGRETAKLLAELIEGGLKQAGTIQLQAEWLISYLKVLSRPHLAQYHHIRQGILTLLLQMTAYAIGASDTLPTELSFAEPFLTNKKSSVGEPIRYQVLQTLLKRLAGLQSTYFLHGENMGRVLDTFSRLQESFLARTGVEGRKYQRFNPVPTREQVEQNMVKLVKWTSSYGDDENGCYLIEESFLEKGEK